MKALPENLRVSLFENPEPALRYFALSQLGSSKQEAEMLESARMALPESEFLSALAEMPANDHPYKKWSGAHWRLLQLAEIGSPYTHPNLSHMRDDVYTWLFSRDHLRSIKLINGRTRRCASQEGNALYSSVRLGQITGQTETLVEKLLGWQWPDGGWNCDRKPEAIKSSFWETWTPLRALLTWRAFAGSNADLDSAIDRSCEVFLKRKLFLSQRSGEVMHPDFVQLFFPTYWYYNILAGLDLMRLAGKLDDPRCKPALDLLETKVLPDGGFAQEKRFFQASNPQAAHFSPVDWGRVNKRKANLWLTVKALRVLREADRS